MPGHLDAIASGPARSAASRSGSPGRPRPLAGGRRPGPPGSPVPSDPVFTALLLDGTTGSGRIRQIGPQGEVALVPAEGPEQVVAARPAGEADARGRVAALDPRRGVARPLPRRRPALPDASIGPATETTLEVQSFALGNLADPAREPPRAWS